ncbi:MAG: alpha/beta hydrolase [Anaerolineae bacterium]|nr:alpha/beta hydrolase [Anaerolineae bacterium]
MSLSPLTLPATGGTLERYENFASAYVQPRHVDVWLPTGYADGHDRYPVLYAHDGQNLFHADISYTGVPWGVDETLTRLVAAGQARPAIVVGMWNTNGRAREYMPQRAFEAASPDAQASFVQFGGGPPLSDAYLRFLTAELKPFIDKAYRTLPDQPNTLIMGSSMGGLISAYAMCEYPAVYGGAACISTHWVAAEGAVVDYLAHALPTAGRHRFYFDYGTLGTDAPYAPFQHRVDDLLRAASYTPGQDWVTRSFPGADHTEADWRARLEIPLTFLLGR